MDRDYITGVTVAAECESEEILISDPNESTTVDRFERSKLIKTELGRAVAKFNFKPKKGIKYLVDNSYLTQDNFKEIAVFLKTTEGLNKTMIGDYLGEDEVANKKVLYEFVDLHDFTGMSFIQSLRSFLDSFRLPGEA